MATEAAKRGGVFGVSRSIWDDPDLDSGEPFSKREAWLWLVSAAAWKARDVHMGQTRISLERGQLIFSLRYLAKRWRWSPMKVSRFLRTILNNGMVAENRTPDGTLITIKNYDKYQVVGLPERGANGAGRDEQRDADETLTRRQRDKEEESKEGKERKTPTAAGQTDGEGYAFEGKVIRLRQKQFDEWREAFNAISLRAELIALDAWYDENLTGAERSRWYVRCANALAKKNAEALAMKRSEKTYGVDKYGFSQRYAI